MSEYVDFHYMPLEGKITGKQVLKQTEDAINDLGNKVYSLDIDQSEIDEAIEKSNEAINTANSALSAVTTGRSVWFNTVAEMIATDVEVGVTAETKGYYVANDGGNALYLIRQEKSGDVVDGGSLIALNNGNMAELVTDGTVNVKQFGAVGNGTDDDTTAFQNTSSYAQAKGFVPFVGVATYKITGSVTGTFNSFGEVTITGGGTVDIINLQEVVSDVSDIRDEVVDETASAKAYSESAATSATNASNSAFSASTTATQLMAYLETKETLTAPAVDPTLTISGAAADAKVTGQRFTTVETGVVNPVLEVGSYNLISNQPVTASVKYRVRTKDTLHLKKGDSIAISDTTIGRYYVLYSEDNGATYKDSNWMRQPWTAQNDQLCVVTLAKQTEDTSAVYTDPSEIGFTLTGQVYPNIDDLANNYIASKNLFNVPWLNGYISTSNGIFTEYNTGLSGVSTRNYVPVDSSTEYTFQWWGIQENASIYVMEYDNSLQFVKYTDYSTGTIGSTTETHVYHLTTSASTKFVRFYISRANMAINRITPTYFQLEKGTVATDPVDGNILNPQMIDYDAGRKRLIDYGVVQNDFYLPDYYFANSYIQNKVARINTLLSGCANNGDAYIFITDEHWSYNQKKSPALLRYISEHCNILKVMDGGDNEDNGSFDFCKKIELAWKKQSGAIHHTAGNHEFFNHTSQATICYYYDMFHDQPYHGNADKLYYYFDNERQKIRYIVCAGFYESETNNNMNGFYLDADQRAWLRDVALNIDTTWNAVIFTHDFWSVSNVNNEIIKYGQSTETLAILDAHNTDATKGKILFIQQGHAHRDRITYTDGGIPIVITTCDKNKILTIDGYPDISSAVDRTSGTINEQAFDVVVINKTLKKATFVRIGGKAQDGINDNPGNLAEEREISWT